MLLSTNTAGHAGIQACGETVRLVGTSTKKQVSMKQESPVKLRCDGRVSIIKSNFDARIVLSYKRKKSWQILEIG